MHNKQAGNVLFLILIAVVLFAALSFAISQSTRTTGGSANDDDANLLAAQVAQYGSALTNALVRMRLSNNCTDITINLFHASFTYNYTNPAAPVSNFCNVFDARGGGVVAQVPPIKAVPTGSPTNQYWYVSCMAVKGIGTDANGANSKELIVQSFLNKDVCMKVNQKFGITNTGGNPPQVSAAQTDPASAAACQYIGSYADTFMIGTSGAGEGVELDGHETGCYQNTADQLYRFYHVLLAR